MTPTIPLSALLALPLLAAAGCVALGRPRSPLAPLFSVGSAGLAMLLAGWLLCAGWDGQPWHLSREWMRLGAFVFPVGFYLNGQSALLLFIVTFVGFWIHVFSLGYMADDPGRSRFFAGLSVFMFAMTGLVLAESLLLLFVFWELVGFSSYLLIGHYFHRPAAAAAANKAFIVNRVGDFGFLLGILWCQTQFGTTSLPELQAMLGGDPQALIPGLALLLFCGVLGKSAQIPLHVWLPDAMEGPTPVSALIHAATMVAAGVYLLGRVWFLFPPEALQVVLVVGTTTAVFAAFCALGTTDIKKILAYSTLSQLGYMVAGFALGTRHGWEQFPADPTAPLEGLAVSHFHLGTHAFFKALLFLAAGSVIHGMHHEQDIFRMGGLWRRMPLTFATFTVGLLALAGLPPLAGFWSKDLILHLAHLESAPVFYLLTGSAFLTAFYMGRLWWTAFCGSPRSEAAAHAHESPAVMTIPLVVLAGFAVTAGWSFAYPRGAFTILADHLPHPEGSAQTLLLLLSLGLALGGIGASFLVYRPRLSADRLQTALPGLYALLRSRLFFDEAYGFYVRQIQQRLADLVSFLDLFLVAGLLGRGSAGVAGLAGWLARAGFNGKLQSYLYWFLAGLLFYGLFAAGIF